MYLNMKNLKRYENSIVYQLCCHDPTITDQYVGSCCGFKKRKWKHKSDCTNPNSEHYNTPVYQFIRENGGWNNWTMIQLVSVACKSKRELESIERQYIEQLRPTLNRQVPTRTHKEYY